MASDKTRNTTLVLTISLICAVCSLAPSVASAETPQAITDRLAKEIDASDASASTKAFVKDKLIPLCTNEVFVKETKAQNDKKTTLDEIKKIDKEWTEAEEELPIQAEKTTNACATEIKKIVKANTKIVEAFVMCNQGAVVGENILTSDYWQGDEEKWTKSYKAGKGGVDVGKVKRDKSTDKDLQQISLPIIDKDGTVIGAVTFGLVVSAD